MAEKLVVRGAPLSLRAQTDGHGYPHKAQTVYIESSADGSDDIAVLGMYGYNQWLTNSSAMILCAEILRVARAARAKLVGPGFTFRHNLDGTILNLPTAISGRLVDRHFEVLNADGNPIHDLLSLDEWMLLDQQPPAEAPPTEAAK